MQKTSNGSDILLHTLYLLDAYAVYRIYTQDSFICASTVSDETMLFLLQVKLVSNETGKGINHAVNAIIEHRSGMDVPPGWKKDLKHGQKHPGQRFIQTEFMLLNRYIISFKEFLMYMARRILFQALKCIFLGSWSVRPTRASLPSFGGCWIVWRWNFRRARWSNVPWRTTFDHVVSERNTSGWLWWKGGNMWMVWSMCRLGCKWFS